MIATLDDLAVAGTTIGLRVDINSPVEDGGLADDARLRAHLETIEELLGAGGRVAIVAHQGRPGGDGFTSLSPHADRLDELLEFPVGFVDTPFGSTASRAIAELGDGEGLVLENTRFYSEEVMAFEPAAAARTHLVRDLSGSFDAYVNDAFAAAHRSQPSLVGFPAVLPSYAGRVMERELSVLGDLEETDRPRLYLLGGAKVSDSIDVAWRLFERDLADRILTGGIVGNLFLVADGVDLGDASTAHMADNGHWDELDRAADLLDAHGDRIELPRDVAVERDGRRHEIGVNALPPAPGEAALDVGAATVDHYRRILAAADTVVLNGPVGVYEDDRFAEGTASIYGAATDVPTSVVGGGDTASALRRLDIDGFTHVSTGGGAALKLVTGEPLPAVSALEDGRPR